MRLLVSPPWFRCCCFWAVPMGLLVLQRDLGMLVLLNAVLLVLAVVATGRISYLFVGVLGAGILGGVMFLFSAHGQARFTAWLTPFADPTGKSWQILQALSAMYSGGLWGVGLGGGSPQFIPIASSDFIYAVIGEELGYAGCGIVLVFYLVLFFRGYQIAARIAAPFGRLLATGIVTTLAFQTLLKYRRRDQGAAAHGHNASVHQPRRKQPFNHISRGGTAAGNFRAGN